jgi:thymidylate kinase
MSKTKLVIIEGCDRVGKDTLISGLQSSFPKTATQHWGYPIGDTNEDKTEFQKVDFKLNMMKWRVEKVWDILDLYIWNRSHLGEYVYGTLYRDSYPDTWVPQLEERFLAEEENAYLILLVADPEFIASQDDGQSYSAKIEDKKEELNKFLDAFQDSKIGNKKLIRVHDENGYFSAEKILDSVINFINQ